MKATLITIGDEILIGQIVDTNSAWMAQQLNAIGVAIYEIITVTDHKDHLLSAFAKAEKQSDLVLITGGLGPTKDDVTKATLCEYFDDVLVEDKQVLEHIRSIFARYVKDDILPENEQQALIPSSATILHNQYGTAPGMWFERNGVIMVSMPGVPFEMKHLMTEQVMPRVKKMGNLPFIYNRTLITSGKGESIIAKMISSVEDALPEDVHLAYLPSAGQVRLRLSSTGPKEVEVRSAVDAQAEAIKDVLGGLVIGESFKNNPIDRLVEVLKESGKTLAVAESCTGGKLASLLTEAPGASAFFQGGAVTYATESKIDVLKIDPLLVQQHSVVSGQVACAMAKAAKELFKADYAISTTGNAGPTKGDSDAPVGTVFIGVATPSDVYSSEFMMGNNRERVLGKTINKSIEIIIEALT